MERRARTHVVLIHSVGSTRLSWPAPACTRLLGACDDVPSARGDCGRETGADSTAAAAASSSRLRERSDCSQRWLDHLRSSKMGKSTPRKVTSQNVGEKSVPNSFRVPKSSWHALFWGERPHGRDHEKAATRGNERHSKQIYE